MAYQDDGEQVQCWHTEASTTCDWDVCNQPDRLARGDYGINVPDGWEPSGSSAMSEQLGEAARQRIVEALRNLAPGHKATRIWGRLDGASPEQAQEGNAWAADPEDVADLVINAIINDS